MTSGVYLTSFGIATIIALAGTYLYQKKKKNVVSFNWEEVGSLKKLHIYPLKSGHRIELLQAECTVFGIKQTENDEKVFQMRDRCLIVYAEKDHEFRTARTYPKMVLIDVGVHDENHLSIDAPTMRTLYVEVPVKTKGNQTAVKIHMGEKIPAIDCGDEAALWFSRYILEKDSGLRLGYHDAKERRDITNTHKTLMDYYKNLRNHSTGLYSDLSSVMLINQASVNDLNTKIGNSPITVENFRPNLVVDGSHLEPYSEDNWDWIKIGEVIFRNVKECTRCVMTTVNPENGTKTANREPLKTLETYRMSNGPKTLPIMGINLEVIQTGLIHVGDTVYISKNEQ